MVAHQGGLLDHYFLKSGITSFMEACKYLVYKSLMVVLLKPVRNGTRAMMAEREEILIDLVY